MEEDCGAPLNDGEHVVVVVANSFQNTSGGQDGGFYIAFIR